MLDSLFLPLSNSPLPTNTDIGCIAMTASITSKQNRNNQPLEKPRIIRWPIVHYKVGFCRSHVHKLVSQGSFPKPIKLGLRSSGWVESEIDTWLEQRIAESRPNNPEAA